MTEERPSPGTPDGDQRSLGGLARHSLIYSAAPLLRQLVSVAMTRLYTAWLGTSGFGVKEVADLWMIGIQQLLGQNALGAMVRFYFDHEDQGDRERVVTSSTLMITLLAWAFCGVALLFSGSLAPLMLGRGEEVSAGELVQILQLTLILIPFQLSSLSGFYYLQILRRSGAYSTLQTAKLLFEVGLNFWLIGALGLGVRGFLMSMLAGEALTSLLLTGWILVSLRPRIDWRILKPILVYAAPLVPVGLSQLGLHQLDRLLLLFFAEEGEGQRITGIYGLSYKIGYLVNAMMLGSFLQIWQPWIFGVTDREERARLVARVSSYAVLAIAGASLVVILFGREAVSILSDEPFHVGYPVVPLIAGGYVFWALYQVSQIPIFLAKRTGRLLVVNLLALMANVGLNAALIPRYGFLGAGIATLVTFAFLALLGMLASRTETKVPFELGRLGATIVCVLAAGCGALLVDVVLVDGAGWSRGAAIALKAAWLAVLGLTLWGGVLRRDERARFLGWIRLRTRRGG